MDETLKTNIDELLLLADDYAYNMADDRRMEYEKGHTKSKRDEIYVDVCNSRETLRKRLEEVMTSDDWYKVFRAVLTTIQKCKDASGLHQSIDLVVNPAQITHDILGTDTVTHSEQTGTVIEERGGGLPWTVKCSDGKTRLLYSSRYDAMRPWKTNRNGLDNPGVQ